MTLSRRKRSRSIFVGRVVAGVSFSYSARGFQVTIIVYLLSAKFATWAGSFGAGGFGLGAVAVDAIVDVFAGAGPLERLPTDLESIWDS
jgi:hypothetical protein